MKDHIKIIDDVFTKDECEKLITIFKNREKESWQTTIVVNMLNEEFPKKLDNLLPEETVDWWQIVEWQDGKGQGFHLDNVNEETTHTSVTYLTDDFEGGETIFESGEEIKPVVGRTLIFDGLNFKHGVKEIKNGMRYTIPVWWRFK